MELIFYRRRQTINKRNNFKSDKCPERHWAERCNNDLQLRVRTIVRWLSEGETRMGGASCDSSRKGPASREKSRPRPRGNQPAGPR